MVVQEVKEIDYYKVIGSMDDKTKIGFGDMEFKINSKTYGQKTVHIGVSDFYALTHFWSGFCIQSTNTKGKGKNPSLYPVVWRYENGRTIVRKIHSVLGLQVPEGYVVDHLDGNTFNNRRNNLEVVTRAENTRRAQVKKGRDV